MAKKEVSWDDESNSIPSNWVSWGVPSLVKGEPTNNGDKIFGTLVRKFETNNTTPEGVVKKVTNYELKADFGSYHKLDEKKNPVEPPIGVEADGFYNIGGREGLKPQMQNIRVGQKIGLKFIEETPSKKKGNAPAKIVKVFAPKGEDGAPLMDTEWLAENQTLDDFAKS